jgi:Uma2 family endonuclease
MVASRAQRHYTFDDYLSVEEMSSVRHEYLDGEILAMAGGTPEHTALSAAIVVLLGKKLEGGPCRPYSSDLRIRVRETGLATYADASVICGEPIRDPDSPTHVNNPSVVVEVLSTSTEEYDRGEKREHYQRSQSLNEYVLVSQDHRQVEVFGRGKEGMWAHSVSRSGESFELASLGVKLAVNDLYASAGLSALRA